MSDSGERVSVKIVQISPEDEERRAHRFPLLAFKHAATSQWRQLTTDFGFQLRLPPEFVENGEAVPDHAMFVAEAGAMFVLTRHEGGGNVFTMIQPDVEMVSYEHEGSFRTEMAGRTVEVQLSRIQLQDRQYYLASTDAGITPGVGVGVALLALSPEQRDLLLNALASIRVDNATDVTGA